MFDSARADIDDHVVRTDLRTDVIDRDDTRRPITVVLAEFVPRHWWEYALHNQTALRIKLALFFRPNTVVIDVPYHVPPEERAP